MRAEKCRESIEDCGKQPAEVFRRILHKEVRTLRARKEGRAKSLAAVRKTALYTAIR
jgi:hypothetical protein